MLNPNLHGPKEVLVTIAQCYYTDNLQQVSLSVAEANGINRASFSSVAIESAATETLYSI